jgi:Zn-dependent protease
VQAPTHRLVFRKSVRLFAMRFGLLLLVTFGGLALLMQPEWAAAAGITALGGLVAIAWFLVTHRRTAAVAVEDEAIIRIDPEDTVRIRWVDVASVTIGEALVPHQAGAIPLRFALVQGIGTRRIAFADLTFMDHHPMFVGAPEPTPVADVADADILLGLIADRVPDSGLLEKLEAAEPPRETEAALAGPEPPAAGTVAPAPGRPRRLGVGLLALAAKIGAKAIAPIAGLFKGASGALAIASAGLLAFVFSWQGVVAIMGMLLFHELGHVVAMRRAGMKVRGIYFIPFMGAAAVTDDTWPTRRHQASIALAGPLWGAVLTAFPVAILAFTGREHPFAAAIAGAWALINLLNLLPIAPLDGGRLLSAVGYSLHSRLGLALSIGALVAGAVAAVYWGLLLFPLLLAVGLAELATDRATFDRMSRLSFAREASRLSASILTKLRLLTRPAFAEPTETRLREIEAARVRQQVKLAAIEPMTPKQAAFWFVAYLLLAAGLAAVVFWIGALHPGLDPFVELLR